MYDDVTYKHSAVAAYLAEAEKSAAKQAPVFNASFRFFI
jgi:hypothetical protein